MCHINHTSHHSLSLLSDLTLFRCCFFFFTKGDISSWMLLLSAKAVSFFPWELLVLAWWLAEPLVLGRRETAIALFAFSSKWSKDVFGDLCCLLVNMDRFLSGWGVGCINATLEKSSSSTEVTLHASSCVSMDVEVEAQNLLFCLFLVEKDVLDKLWLSAAFLCFISSLLFLVGLCLPWLILTLKTSTSESLLVSYSSSWLELSPFSTGFFPLQARSL